MHAYTLSRDHVFPTCIGYSVLCRLKQWYQSAMYTEGLVDLIPEIFEYFYTIIYHTTMYCITHEYW